MSIKIQTAYVFPIDQDSSLQISLPNYRDAISNTITFNNKNDFLLWALSDKDAKKILGNFSLPLEPEGSIKVKINRQANNILLNFIADEGTPVKAMQSGTVVKVISENENSLPAKTKGNQVWIQDKAGTIWKYYHLQAVNDLEIGQNIKLDQVFANSGSSGRASGPNLTISVMH